MEYLSLEKINAYVISYKLSNTVWALVHTWDKFAMWTIGKQFVDAADSIFANIAEGFGRFHKKDKILFYRYSASSVKECLDWAQKSFDRGLITEARLHHILEQLNALPKEINTLIKITNNTLKW